jgi:hypothetical protein
VAHKSYSIAAERAARVPPPAAMPPPIACSPCTRRARGSYHAGMTSPVGCVWEFLRDHSLFITYCDDAATPEQWMAYLEALRGLKGRQSRLLIYAEAVPPREVLADIASIARGEPWNVALISRSLAVRFAASTFALVVKGFRFFTPDAVGPAIEQLGCDDAQTLRAISALARMRGAGDPLSSQP